MNIPKIGLCSYDKDRDSLSLEKVSHDHRSIADCGVND